MIYLPLLELPQELLLLKSVVLLKHRRVRRCTIESILSKAKFLRLSANACIAKDAVRKCFSFCFPSRMKAGALVSSSDLFSSRLLGNVSAGEILFKCQMGELVLLTFQHEQEESTFSKSSCCVCRGRILSNES